MESKELIRGFIKDNFLLGSSNKSFQDDDSFLENGIIDSTGILELVSFIEEKFSIDVRDEELVPDNFDSVDRLADYISRKAAG